MDTRSDLDASLYIHTCAPAHQYTGSNFYSDADSDSHTYPDADTRAHMDTRFDLDARPHIYPYAPAHQYARSDLYTDAHRRGVRARNQGRNTRAHGVCVVEMELQGCLPRGHGRCGNPQRH